MAYMQKGIDDVVFLNLEYPNKVIANIHVSWLDPQKVRKMIVVGSRKMVVYDDIAEDKITIYDKGIDRKAILGENMDLDRKSTRLNSSHTVISYAVFCLNHPSHTEIYTLSLHDALPIS